MPTPPDSRQRAWARFVTAQAMLLERIEAAFDQAGLPPLAWYDVLWILENAEAGRLRMHDLARKAVVSRSNVTRLSDRMEKAGLVARSDCTQDGRGTVCELTDAGRRLRGRMWPVYKQQIDSLFGKHVGARDAETLAATFQKMIDSMQRATP
ncbi:MAG: MarR family transcriptional regulator [Candidatus Parcubacteria bacterium]|nr:MarR family transcriptional regulator [Burkholderiales bacterium]